MVMPLPHKSLIVIPPSSHSYEFGGGGLFLDPRDSALGFMSLRAPGRDPPRPVIPGAELRQGDD